MVASIDAERPADYSVGRLTFYYRGDIINKKYRDI